MMAVIAPAVVLGLSCGFAPGALTTLVVMQTLQHGLAEGRRVSLAPLLTDGPVILLALFLAAQVAWFKQGLAVLSIVGGTYLLRLAWNSFQPVRINTTGSAESPKSWRKAIITNLLNPNPWLFWMTVGAASLSQAMTKGWPAAALFLVVFYICIVGSKMLIAVIAAKARPFLSGRGYRIIMGGLGVLMAVYAATLLYGGMRTLLGR